MRLRLGYQNPSSNWAGTFKTHQVLWSTTYGALLVGLGQCLVDFFSLTQMISTCLRTAQLDAVISADIASSSLFMCGEDMLLLTPQLFVPSFRNIWNHSLLLTLLELLSSLEPNFYWTLEFNDNAILVGGVIYLLK